MGDHLRRIIGGPNRDGASGGSSGVTTQAHRGIVSRRLCQRL